MEKLYKFPYVHKHGLSKNGKLKGKCCVCKKIDENKDCYYCLECDDFYFCFDCEKHTEESVIKKLHRHLLVVKKRYMWKCDICKQCTYSSGLSMCCEQCDFDVCVGCFWGLKKEEIIY